MVFYTFLGIVLLVFGAWFMRSAMFKQLTRGHGSDAGQWGSGRDHLADLGTGGQAIGDDASGGRRESRIQSKHTRRR